MLARWLGVSGMAMNFMAPRGRVTEYAILSRTLSRPISRGTPMTPDRTSASLHTRDGRRKYLTAEERARFIAAAARHPRREIGTPCLLLIHSGCGSRRCGPRG